MNRNITKAFTQNLFLSGFALMSVLTSSVYANEVPKVIAQSSLAETSVNLQSENQLCKNQPFGDLYTRTELFFGLSKPDGSVVTDQEFTSFIDQEITPRFPDGLTLLNGTGQFKDSSGVIIREESRLLILLYPVQGSGISSLKVEQIRAAYKNAFQQESVLRSDSQECTSF